MMNKYSKYVVVISILFSFVSCKQKEDKADETILKGTATILVDETLTPIIEDQVAVFESSYDAKITIIPLSEAELIVSLFKDNKSGIAVLSRNLTDEENKVFKQKKITPKITKFAQDAIPFISNKSSNDTLIALEKVLDFMKGKSNTKIKGLVFDNPNSSLVRYLNTLAGIQQIPSQGVFSFKTNDEVIKFVAENDGMIGVVGVNWLSQPKPSMQKYVNDVNVLSVKGLHDSEYFAPSQNNIAEGKYPLAQDLFIIKG